MFPLSFIPQGLAHILHELLVVRPRRCFLRLALPEHFAANGFLLGGVLRFVHGAGCAVGFEGVDQGAHVGGLGGGGCLRFQVAHIIHFGPGDVNAV